MRDSVWPDYETTGGWLISEGWKLNKGGYQEDIALCPKHRRAGVEEEE